MDEGPSKFLTDRSLGTLTKWLRLLGFDTDLYPGDADRGFLKAAWREGRAVITRKRDLANRQYRGQMMVIQSDRVEEQLGEVLTEWDLRPEKVAFFSRCLRCNVLLAPIPKEEAKDRVPPYTYDTQEQFMICPSCRGIFWPGTHVEKAAELIKKRIRKNRP